MNLDPTGLHYEQGIGWEAEPAAEPIPSPIPDNLGPTPGAKEYNYDGLENIPNSRVWVNKKSKLDKPNRGNYNLYFYTNDDVGQEAHPDDPYHVRCCNS